MKKYFYPPGQHPWHYKWFREFKFYREWVGGVWIMEYRYDYSLGASGPIRVWSKIAWEKENG
jgi:hypothetical protein